MVAERTYLQSFLLRLISDCGLILGDTAAYCRTPYYSAGQRIRLFDYRQSNNIRCRSTRSEVVPAPATVTRRMGGGMQSFVGRSALNCSVIETTPTRWAVSIALHTLRYAACVSLPRQVASLTRNRCRCTPPFISLADVENVTSQRSAYVQFSRSPTFLPSTGLRWSPVGYRLELET